MSIRLECLVKLAFLLQTRLEQTQDRLSAVQLRPSIDHADEQRNVMQQNVDLVARLERDLATAEEEVERLKAEMERRDDIRVDEIAKMLAPLEHLRDRQSHQIAEVRAKAGRLAARGEAQAKDLYLARDLLNATRQKELKVGMLFCY
ncbi:unnamed protein product [Protopolystoma xenopodis]|uniref:Uncharacterized protein n=1 Tax=Protopolystoma xenopodis TaxID=117903 RepID=A0A3S5FCN5_9PLAT|nr:unnamed protein product [Protopolystoma xenopodis]